MSSFKYHWVRDMYHLQVMLSYHVGQSSCLDTIHHKFNLFQILLSKDGALCNSSGEIVAPGEGGKRKTVLYLIR